MNHFNQILGFLIAIISFTPNSNLQAQDFTRNDSLNLFLVTNNGASPTFGYTDLDISGDYAIWESTGFANDFVDVNFQRYSPNTKSWNTIRDFSFPMPCYGGQVRGPEVALSDSLGVFTIFKKSNYIGCGGPYWANLQLLERTTDGGWIKGQVIRPYDLPDSIKMSTKILRGSGSRSFGAALDVNDNTLAVSTITKNDNIGLVLIYEKSGAEWEVKQVLSHPQPFSENQNIRDFGKDLKFLENGELYIQSGNEGNEHYIFERMEENWELKDVYYSNFEEGYSTCVVNEDYVIRWKGADRTLSIFDRDTPDTPTQTFSNMSFNQPGSSLFSPSNIKLLDWVSERHMVSYQTQTTGQRTDLVLLALDEDGWEKVDTIRPSITSQLDVQCFGDFFDIDRIFVTDRQLVLRDVNTFCALEAIWFDISTTCRPARAVEFSLSPDQENLVFKWFSSFTQKSSKIRITNSSGELFSSDPEFIEGIGNQEYSIPLELLEPDTFRAKIKSYCNANPFQESSFSQPLEYVLEGLCQEPTEFETQYSFVNGGLHAKWSPPAGASQCEFQWRSSLVPDETTSVLLSGDTIDQYNVNELVLLDNQEYRVKCDCNVTDNLELAVFSDWQPVAYPQCPEQDEDIFINSQEQLDILRNSFPNCSVFFSEVRINGANATNPIVNFSGFPMEKIRDKFLIQNCNSLNDLTGLEGLLEIDALVIANNASLTDLSPLGDLEKVRGNLRMKNTPIDWTTDPFTSLTQVGDVELDNVGSGTFHGFSQVRRFYVFFLNADFSMENCDFDSIYFYGDWLNQSFDFLSIDIRNNPNLKWIEPGPEVKRLEQLNLVNNGIENLGGLNHIEEIEYDADDAPEPGLFIIGNDQLVSLSGLNQTLSFLRLFIPIEITGNPLLNECAIEPLCGILETHNEGSVTIGDNGPLCSDYDEVIDLCPEEMLIQQSAEPASEFDVDLFPNPANASLTILTTAEGFTYRMYDLTGRLVTSGNTASTAFELPTASFAEGIYLLRIETTEGVAKMNRVVIEH